MTPLLALLVGLAAAPAATAQDGNPLASCTVKRSAIGDNTSVTLFCGLAQVAARRLPQDSSASARLEAYHGQLTAIAKQLKAQTTWNTATIELGGTKRLVAQYTLLQNKQVVRTGLVAPGRVASEVVECSSADETAAGRCKDLVDAVLKQGLPAGVTFLPFASDLRSAKVLGTPVKVILGCKAQWVFDDAVHVLCADGELIFGAATELSADGMGGDPIDALQKQAGGKDVGTEKDCKVAGNATKCWTAVVDDNGVKVELVTARPTVGGKKAMLACSYTKIGTDMHPLCAQILSF